MLILTSLWNILRFRLSHGIRHRRKLIQQCWLGDPPCLKNLGFVQRKSLGPEICFTIKWPFFSWVADILWVWPSWTEMLGGTPPFSGGKSMFSAKVNLETKQCCMWNYVAMAGRFWKWAVIWSPNQERLLDFWPSNGGVFYVSIVLCRSRLTTILNHNFRYQLSLKETKRPLIQPLVKLWLSLCMWVYSVSKGSKGIANGIAKFVRLMFSWEF